MATTYLVQNRTTPITPSSTPAPATMAYGMLVIHFDTNPPPSSARDAFALLYPVLAGDVIDVVVADAFTSFQAEASVVYGPGPALV